jgi:hypothetical protein
VIKKFHHPHFGSFLAFSLLNRKSIADHGLSLNRLSEISGNIAKSLGVKKGVFMVDIIQDEYGGLKVIDTALRPGSSFFVPLMQELYGYTSLSVLIGSYFSSKKKYQIPDKEGLVVMYYAKNSGIIHAFDLAELKKIPGYIDSFCYESVGSKVKGKTSNDMIVGFGMFRLDESISQEKIISEVNEKMVLEVR